MSVRFDASGDSLSRTTGLPATSAFTMAAWVKQTATRDGTIFDYGTTNHWQVYVGTNVLKIFNNSVDTSGSTLTNGVWYHVAFCSTGTALKLYLNGVLDISATGSGSPAAKIWIGNDNFSEWFNGCVTAVKIWGVELTADEIKAEMRSVLPRRMANLNAWHPLLTITGQTLDYSSNNNNWTVGGTLATEDGPGIPWGNARRQITTKTASLGAYTLTAAKGTFTLTGVAATLKAGHVLSAAAGAYTLTGKAASVVRGYPLTAAAGAFTLTGKAATLTEGRKLTAAVGTFSLTGVAASLKEGHSLAASAGAFTLTGVAASLKATHLLSAAKGTFTLSGQDASLRTTGSFSLTANAGSFALTGKAASLLTGRKLTALRADFALSGQAVSLKPARRLTAAAGSFTLTGQPATLTSSATPEPTPTITGYLAGRTANGIFGLIVFG